jgi:hypothetical protein
MPRPGVRLRDLLEVGTEIEFRIPASSRRWVTTRTAIGVIFHTFSFVRSYTVAAHIDGRDWVFILDEEGIIRVIETPAQLEEAMNGNL